MAAFNSTMAVANGHGRPIAMERGHVNGTGSASTRFTLEATQIHVWCVDFNLPISESLLRRYRLLLTEEERHKELRYYFPQDQIRYLLTRALVRTVLSKYTARPPESLEFSANPYGKPELSGDMNGAPVSFNISHTPGLIVIAVRRAGALGIDTENTRSQSAPLEIAERFFSTEEVASLRAHPKSMQGMRFFQYWTLKESYIKARGKGLSIPLHQFGFSFYHAIVKVDIQPAQNDQASRWKFWQFELFEDYLVAVCAARTVTSSLELVVRKIVPLEKEEMLDYRLICESF